MNKPAQDAIARALEDITARLHDLEAERLAARSALMLLVRRMDAAQLVEAAGLCEDLLMLVSVNEEPDGAGLRAAIASLAHDLQLACLPQRAGAQRGAPPQV